MLKFNLIILILIVDFLLINYLLIPASGSGQTFIEIGAVIGTILLIQANYKIIKKLLTNKKQNEKTI